MERLEDFFLEEKTIPDDLLWYGAVSFQKNGAVIPWRIGTLDAKSGDALRRACTNDRGVTDMGAFLCRLACACVKYPDLKNAKLQDSWGVMGEEALLQAMLTAGEYTSLCCAVLSHNAFPDRMQTLYEQAKK